MPRFNPFAFTISLLWPALLWGQEAQIEQARQQNRLPASGAREGYSDFPELTLEGAVPRNVPAEGARPFSAFAEVSAFLTNNAALTRNAKEDDRFFVATAGTSYRQSITSQVRATASVLSSLYRYDHSSRLDFQSIDLSVGLTWSPSQLGGTEFRLRYLFTDLTDRHADEFFNNHGILVGAQKSFALGKAHSLYGGVNAEWDWSDPKASERDAYSAFVGYRVQATRQIDADLYYRYARYLYSEGDGRQDNNQLVALTWRYEPVEWASLSATGYFTWNRSTQSEFNYDALTAGIALQAEVKF